MNRKNFFKPLPVLLLVFFASQMWSETVDENTAYFSQAELDQMLAPIALYPDALLSQVLMASTYPLEVVEASRWSKEVDLEGEVAVSAAQSKNWDISIKALVAFPDLLQLMDQQLSWTRKLGDAFLLQEEQVMETVQLLRRKSLDEGNLDSLDHLVVREQDEVIIVEPKEVEVIYVPYYNTRYVYGDWWWYDYPPIYWDFPSYRYSSLGFHWSRGFNISSRFYFSFCDWHHRDILLYHHRWNHDYHRKPTRDDMRHDHHPDSKPPDGHHDTGSGIAHLPDRAEREDIKVWNHSPLHRRGVEYRGENLNRTLDRSSASGVASAGLPSRLSRSGNSSLKRPDSTRDSSGNRLASRSNKSGDDAPSTLSKKYRSTDRTSRELDSSSIPASRSNSRYSLPASNNRERSTRTLSRSTLPENRSTPATTTRTSPSSSTRSNPPQSYNRSSSTRETPPRQASSTTRPSTSRSYSRTAPARTAPARTAPARSEPSRSSSTGSRNYSSSRSSSSNSSSGSGRSMSGNTRSERSTAQIQYKDK